MLIRSVVLPALSPAVRRYVSFSGYLVVGEGAADELAAKNFPCVRGLSPSRRQVVLRYLRLDSALAPSGAAFCFVVVPHPPGIRRPVGRVRAAVRPLLGGLCDTFADAATGYGANEIAIAALGGFASIVPDDVATVVMHYAHRTAISAAVHDNVYWARVSQVPPLGGGPPLRQPAAVRRAILMTLPASIDWLGAGGQALRTFTPPRRYVDVLVRRYDACVKLKCGY